MQPKIPPPPKKKTFKWEKSGINFRKSNRGGFPLPGRTENKLMCVQQNQQNPSLGLQFMTTKLLIHYRYYLHIAEFNAIKN